VLTLFLKRALNQLPPVVFGTGDQVRDFVYVGDIAALHRACLERDLDGHVALNGSTGIGTTIVDLARAVCQLSGIESGPVFDEVVPGERSELAEGRMRLPSELQTMTMSFDRARETVGWSPKVDLMTGLEREWKWLCDNPGRWSEMSY
jgi:UDP-glucose 4-epimerase